jgi:hypothetical protein
MCEFRVHYKKSAESIIEKVVEKHPLDGLFDESIKNARDGSVFCFDRGKWRCKMLDKQEIKEIKEIRELHNTETIKKIVDDAIKELKSTLSVPVVTGQTGPQGDTGPPGPKGDTGVVYYGDNDNVLVGQDTGKFVEGRQNTYVGDNVCSTNVSSGSYNVFVGSEAGLNNTDGLGNTFLGTVAGASNTSGNFNIFLGQSAGRENEIGTNNIFIGTNAGSSNTEGDYNICIGDGSDTSNSNAVNQIVIGQGVQGKADNTITFPENLTSFSSGTEVNFSSPNGGMLYPVSSSRRWKTNIKDIANSLDTSLLYKLRPVSFTPIDGHDSGNTINGIDIGLIAEEVDQYFPNLVPKDIHGQPASVKYSLLSVLLLEEVKKLKKEIEEIKNEVSDTI